MDTFGRFMPSSYGGVPRWSVRGVIGNAIFVVELQILFDRSSELDLAFPAVVVEHLNLHPDGKRLAWRVIRPTSSSRHGF